MITQSFNATRKGFGRSTYPDTYSYQKDILFHLPHVYERMKGVKVLHGDGIDLIAKIAENPNAFVMADLQILEEKKPTRCMLVNCQIMNKEGF